MENAQTGAGAADTASAYGASFGMLPHGSRYSGGYLTTETKSGAFDRRPWLLEKFQAGAEIVRKALNSATGGAGSTDKVLVPIYLDPVIIDLSRKWTPLVELIPRVSNFGLTADYNVITAKGAAVVKAEDAALTEADSTYARRSKAIKYLYSVGRVTGQALAAIPAFMLAGFQPTGIGAPDGALADVNAPNARQLELLDKTRAIKELEENLILNGDSVADPNDYDGIIVQIAGVNDKPLVGADIALADLHDGVQLAFDDGGRPNLGVCNSRTYTDILKLLSAQITYREATRQVFWGFSAVVFYSMVGEIPIIPSMWLTNAVDLGRLIFLDLSVIELRVLQDLTYETLAKTNDSEKFFLKIYETLIVRAPQFCAQITQID